ncbi:iron-sulfur cluster assembly ATPase SufC [Staphylococcus aureus]|uniref:Iron-sulfur cluster assembly ATPase SufC n=1 Tax=Staphylococcus aureus TaxID=1280 RepID=A0A380E0I5_STAAU|nr:iron-sulfur cluster assembly ATPase SufC [Staphylococcus aureus]
MASTLEIKDLHVSIEDKEILKGVNLTINTDENTCDYGTKRDR